MKYIVIYPIFIENESLLSGQLEEISQDIAILVFENDNDSPKDSLRYLNNKYTSIIDYLGQDCCACRLTDYFYRKLLILDGTTMCENINVILLTMLVQIW